MTDALDEVLTGSKSLTGLAPFLETNRERITPDDNSPIPLKQQTGAFLRTRHQWILLFVQNKNSHEDSLLKKLPLRAL
jgi:hypothetical protein